MYVFSSYSVVWYINYSIGWQTQKHRSEKTNVIDGKRLRVWNERTKSRNKNDQKIHKFKVERKDKEPSRLDDCNSFQNTPPKVFNDYCLQSSSVAQSRSRHLQIQQLVSPEIDAILMCYYSFSPTDPYASFFCCKSRDVVAKTCILHPHSLQAIKDRSLVIQLNVTTYYHKLNLRNIELIVPLQMKQYFENICNRMSRTNCFYLHRPNFTTIK